MNKYKYEIIVYWSDEDEAYIAEVPELSGCMADGKTYEEVINNVQLIISEWIETAKKLERPIPKPKGKLALKKEQKKGLLLSLFFLRVLKGLKV